MAYGTGITTVDTILDRIVALLREKLGAEIDLIDTKNNDAAGAGSVNHFTTPDVPAACIQPYVDRKQDEAIRIVVADAGVAQAGEGHVWAQGNGSEPNAQDPRLSRKHEIRIVVFVSDHGGVQTTSGGSDEYHARRVCNRVADAALVTLMRYPQLDVPSLMLGVLVESTTLLSEGRASFIEEGDQSFYGRELKVAAWCNERRAA